MKMTYQLLIVSIVLASTLSSCASIAMEQSLSPSVLALTPEPLSNEPVEIPAPIALYTFQEGTGRTVFDRSGVSVPLNLTVRDPDAIRWLQHGVAVVAPTIFVSPGPASKVIEAARKTHELTVEAWVKSQNIAQDGPARIITLSKNTHERNFTIGQGMWNDLPSSLYDVRLRTTETNEDGRPGLSTASGLLTTDMTHIVYTRTISGIARLFLNGVEQANSMVGGDLSNWDATYRLGLANEMTGNRPWIGELHHLAIYDQALSATAAKQRFDESQQAMLSADVSAPATPAFSVPLPTPTPVGNIATDNTPVATTIPDPQSYFPLGIFEDSNQFGGDRVLFKAVIHDITSRSFDSIMFTNSSVERDAPLLDVSDEMGFNVFMLPANDLNENWWPEEIPADEQTARRVAEPIVAQYGAHTSFRGYLVKDEPQKKYQEKVALMTQALQELDPARPATPILVGKDVVGPIFNAAQPKVMLIDVYPIGYSNPIGDFTLTGFGYRFLDFVDYIRKVTKDKPDTTPVWIILQTHSFGNGESFSLREPLPSEVRAQHWMAIGEGVTGIFWFIYSSQQDWKGLAANPLLYDEVTTLARRTVPLRDTLLSLHKAKDIFEITGVEQAFLSKPTTYISTLTNDNESTFYAVVVNRDCIQEQALTIHAPSHTGQLRDLETGETYDLDTPITLQPGDGKMLELVETMP